MKKKIILSILLASASLQSFGMQNSMPNGAAAPSCANAAAVGTNAKFVHPREHEKQAFYKLLLSKPWGKVSQQYITKLQQEEKQLLQDFFMLAGITQEQWEAYKMQLDDWYCKAERIEINSAEWAPPSFIQSTKQCMELIPKNLIIAGVPQYRKEVCYCQRNVMYIKWYVASTFTPNFFNSSINHELVHILHDDSFVRYCITNKSVAMGLANNQQFRCLQKRILNFQESRADILSLLCNEQFPTAQMECNSSFFNLDFDDGEHPTPMQKISYCAQINQEMQNAIISQNRKKRAIVPNLTSFIGQHYGKIALATAAVAMGFAAYWWGTLNNGTAQPKST